ncbi:HDIG domain-containing protein [Candidatus Pacearchaeota archaeon]|jgi:putative nucleotidyltransferase with HDIG domain|nr:HDIG domain-containing protein [Candidatus Pacearchaeota archaeon]
MILDHIRQIAHSNYSEEISNVTNEEVDALSQKDLLVLHSIMIGPHVSLALAVLQRIGFFADLIPEIQAGLDLQSSKHFKEIWPHTIRVVGQTPPVLNVRWAALFHDLGKAKAFEIKNNKVTFHNHEHISAGIFNQFSKRTGIFSSGQRRSIRFLIANLGYMEAYESNWTDTAVRRLDKEVGIFLEDLLTLSESDITTSKPENRRRILRRIQELRDRIKDIREKDSKQCPLPKGLGSAIVDNLGIPLGPRIGQLRKELEEKIDRGELFANETITYYIEHLRKSQVEETTNT